MDAATFVEIESFTTGVMEISSVGSVSYAINRSPGPAQIEAVAVSISLADGVQAHALIDSKGQDIRFVGTLEGTKNRYEVLIKGFETFNFVTAPLIVSGYGHDPTGKGPVVTINPAP